MLLTFNDVLIEPQFSTINSRSEVILSSMGLNLPVLAANMDTITESVMATAMSKAGGAGVLHRFMDIDKNIRMFKETALETNPAWVSVGIGNKEYERATALVDAGALDIVVDVAHGAQQQVVDFSNRLLEYSDDFRLTIGNFAGNGSIAEFMHKLDNGKRTVGIKIGIGPGAMCTTRIKTGVGVPQLSAIQEAAKLKSKFNMFLIADGGLKTPGDIAKALGAGADLVMVGGMLAGTDETPGELMGDHENGYYKKYRGSASKESYEDQGKTGKHFTTEGESTILTAKGSATDILKDIEGGLRSAFTYVGARNIQEFHENVFFNKISVASYVEGTAHGKSS